MLITMLIEEHPTMPFPADALFRITLGTVQFGMPYGKARRTQPPGDHGLVDILDAAMRAGITCLDTARNYGDAETRIGGWLAASEPKPLIVSKLPPIDIGDNDIPDHIEKCLTTSLTALGLERLDGYLIHRAPDLHRPGVVASLQHAVEAGRIGAFGVSVYEPQQLADALAVPGMGLVQLPASLLDQRFADSGLIERCAEQGVVVFARSLFLQGALLLPDDELPEHLLPIKPTLSRLRGLASESGCGLQSLALAGVLLTPGVESGVIGIANCDELEENLAALQSMPGNAVVEQARRIASGIPPHLLDPRRWPAFG